VSGQYCQCESGCQCVLFEKVEGERGVDEMHASGELSVERMK